MYCTRRVNDDYTWVGADGRRLAMFEGVFDVPAGISFNSYLLRDEKTVLFDTTDAAVRRTFRENLLHALEGRSLDCVVVHHMEPDHTAELEELVLRFPEVQIYCSAMAKTMMTPFFGPGLQAHLHAAKAGDTLCTGPHTLRSMAAPMVPRPGKYGSQVQTVLKKAAELDIAMLLPLHGFVWRKELGYLLHKYDLWSRYEPEERGVLIAYASVYGNTENAANILACRLSERGVRVQMFDTSVTPTSYILSAAFRYSHLVFAATTYNAGVFITMEELLHDIAAHNLQNRRVALLENGSWAPASGKGMQKILQPLKGWQQLEDTFTIRSALREDQTMQLERLAATLAADVQAAAPAEEKPEGQHRYVCKVCGYVYEGDSLPEDYKCPLCGAGAEYFKQES